MTDTIAITPVIMSGGSGTRLWPMSRKARPKQLRALMSDETLLQGTAKRASGSAGGVRFEAPVIVCNAAHKDEIQRQLADAGRPAQALILEPMGRNTAPCAASAAALAAETNPESLLLLLPADHHIHDADGFRGAIAQGAEAALDGDLVTFGIRPSAPETGYGYIKRGAAKGAVFAVEEFKEKPDRATAERYIADGSYSWNAGIFLFRADRLAEEMAAHCPDVLEQSRKAVQAARREGAVIDLDAAAFEACPSISIDYAVMEKTERAAVLPMDIGWSDIGSWAALWELAEKDETGVAQGGEAIVIDSRNTFVKTDGPMVAAIGVEDLVIVVSDGAVLVARRDQAQDVKAVVEALKASGRSRML